MCMKQPPGSVVIKYAKLVMRGEKTVKKKKKTSGSWCFHHCYVEKGNDIRAAAGFILNSLLMAKNNTRKVISHSLIIANSNTVDDFPDLLYIAL